ncbi:hypothetical protein PVAP13_7KG359880 [Panicum virgatum]|uniref:Uncharacterized protein n=1 Tax=Panicum virgatum TaxID=38727 RepID=A0A8T0QLD2_PANVG|nr:hypothetical protein PVAP13_7KG359880 [Panicum virgatum]
MWPLVSLPARHAGPRSDPVPVPSPAHNASAHMEGAIRTCCASLSPCFERALPFAKNLGSLHPARLPFDRFRSLSFDRGIIRDGRLSSEYSAGVGVARAGSELRLWAVFG